LKLGKICFGGLVTLADPFMPMAYVPSRDQKRQDVPESVRAYCRKALQAVMMPWA
jgi:hypothetical protein